MKKEVSLAVDSSRERAQAALTDLETLQAGLVDAFYCVLLRQVPDEAATRR